MQQNRTEELGTEKVGSLLFRLAMPAIAAQIINLLYNLVDRMYIGHIPEVGKLALTGVGVCLPLIMIISAFAALAGMGAAPRASIFLGQGNKESAEKTLGNAFTLLFGISLVLTAVFFVFSRPLLLMFGASENTVDYGESYMRIYSLGTLFVQMTLGLNAFISAQGFAKTSMMTVLIGAVCNIVLDPIFIFGFDMGVAGAAWATIISQAVSMVWILLFLTGKKATLRLRAKHLPLKAGIVLPAVALGLSPFIMQATESLLAVCFNASLLKYGGDIAVGAMTILTSVMQFSMLPLQGLSQGAQPILSYNYGAGNAQRVRDTFKLLLISCLAYSTALWALAQLFPQMFVLIFNNDPELLVFASHALRVYMAVSLVFGAQIACQQTFIALGNAKSSLFLALLRKIFLLIPLIYILPLFFSAANKTTAVFLAEPVADLLAVGTTVVLFTIQFKKSMKLLSQSAAKDSADAKGNI
ncbi:MAG: MATE family efflux transporter [Ruthenibacterium sp.]